MSTALRLSEAYQHLEQPALHDLERLGLLRADFGLAVIDEQPRQIEHAGHLGDDGDHVQRLDPEIDVFEHELSPAVREAEVDDPNALANRYRELAFRTSWAA